MIDLSAMTVEERAALLKEWGRLAEGATDGPWYWEQPGEKSNGFVVGVTYPPSSGLWREWCDEHGSNDNAPDDYPEPVEQVCEQWGATVNYEDAAFIASSREALPALRAYVAELEGRLAEVKGQHEQALRLAAQWKGLYHGAGRRLEEAEEAADGLLRALVNEGHTKHCARRLAWGDGECECGGVV